MNHLERHSTRLVGLVLGVFFLLSLVLAWQEAATFDERAHVAAAYSYVRYGDMRLNPEHPPLLKDLAGIPLLFLDLSFPINSNEWKNGVNEQWAVGREFVFGSGNDADRVMFWARVPMILVALLLGLFVYRWTKELAGTTAGLFALILYAADPNVIAHGHYVTTDLGNAAAVFMAVYYFVRFLRTPSARNTVLFGVFLGIAELTKFSAILLFPYFGLVILLYTITGQRAETTVGSGTDFFLKRLFDEMIRYAGAIVVCCVLIWGVYAVNTINEPGARIADHAAAMFSGDNAASIFARGTVATLSESAITKPFAQYSLGVFMVVARVAEGNTYYFLGQVSDAASPWYFPTVFLLKETLPFLVLLVFGSLYALYRIGRAFADRTTRTRWTVFARFFQSRIAQFAMFGFVVFYALVSAAGNLNIGFRHLFPVLPFLHVLIAKSVFDFARRSGIQGERATRVGIAGLAVWIASVPVLAYPSYLSYFNEAAGGPAEGYRYVTDSNYDWGQDLKRLRDFVHEFNACKAGTGTVATCRKYDDILRHPAIDELFTAYFGGADPQYYLGETYVEWGADRGRRPGWHAISANTWQESLYRENSEGRDTYRWIVDGEHPMVWRAGDSIFVFYVPPWVPLITT